MIKGKKSVDCYLLAKVFSQFCYTGETKINYFKVECLK